ncbi:MAG: DNA mismatch repair protein MutT [Gammaproteobacteria bacterium HGW-Gammaproteobacteria-14]|nr:MAG: DNA mismatch repair protein MutT [Gammaproteobacteria bacterium HGW-Gammaproteobacteria-14]
MRLLHTLTHPEVNLASSRVLRRTAARGIVLDGDEILLLYTQRYDDFSFPGGGIDDGENLETGLQRELEEETGARDIQVLSHYGFLDEYRPHWKPEYDLMYMRSHFFHCQVHRQLGETRLEPYEQANGMVPQWVSLNDAIHHNEMVMARKASSMGQSIHRETLMLKEVRDTAERFRG